MNSTTKPGGWLSKYRSLSLGLRILIWMGAGVLAGIVFGQDATIVKPVGDIFIRMLLMAAIPLVFFNLIAGIISLPDVSALGRLGVRTIAYYVCTTTVALALGLFFAHVLQPGVGMQLSEPVGDTLGAVPGITRIVTDLFPENVFQAFAAGNVTQVVVFAIFLGVSVLMLPDDPKARLKSGFELVARLLRELVHLVLFFAPVGVGALAAATVGEYGDAIFGPLAKFIGTVWLAHLVMIVVYLAALFLATRRSPAQWLKTTAPLYATTAATCSSLASLVVSMEIAEKKLRIPKRIYSFTLPLGAQLNKDGTAIMLTVVLLFTAQAAGIEFSLMQQVTIVIIGLILSEGSGGIPGGGLIIALIFVDAFNLPLEIAGIVAGIYRLIDMGGTTVNCMGDLIWTTILSDMEARNAKGDSS